MKQDLFKRNFLALFLFAFLVTFDGGPDSNAQTKGALSRDTSQTDRACLPTGVCLDAAGLSFVAGNMLPAADRR